MSKSDPRVSAVAEQIRAVDKIAAKYRVSRVTHLNDRASALGHVDASAHAAYSLAWLVETGRLSAELEGALLDLPARAFATAAVRIADSLASVRACADAWREVATKAYEGATKKSTDP